MTQEAAASTTELLAEPPDAVPRGGHALAIPAYRAMLVPTPGVNLAERPRVYSHIEAAPILADYIGLGVDREHLVAMFLDLHQRVLGLNTVAIGHATGAPLHPRELFRPAILAGAATIILAHNHPSGDARPSDADIVNTRDTHALSQLLYVPLVDHIIFGHSAKDYVSLRQSGLAVTAWRDEARLRDPQVARRAVRLLAANMRRPPKRSATRVASLRAALWRCARCRRLQLGRRPRCRYCGTARPQSSEP